MSKVSVTNPQCQRSLSLILSVYVTNPQCQRFLSLILCVRNYDTNPQCQRYLSIILCVRCLCLWYSVSEVCVTEPLCQRTVSPILSIRNLSLISSVRCLYHCPCVWGLYHRSSLSDVWVIWNYVLAIMSCTLYSYMVFLICVKWENVPCKLAGSACCPSVGHVKLYPK